MTKAFGRPTQKNAGKINFGLNTCHIKEIEDVTKEKQRFDLALVFTLGFPDTDWERKFFSYFDFERDQKGNLVPGNESPALRRFYERFVDYLGLTNFGVDEKGNFIHTEDGSKIVAVADYLKTKLRMNDDSYLAYVTPNEWQGKIRQSVDFLVDSTNHHACKQAESYITWKESLDDKSTSTVQPEEDNNEELPI